MSSWQEREARNQSLFREVNERIEEVGESFATEGLGSFVCECGNTDCRQTIDLSHLEYEAVRAHASRFLVVLNHENPEAESVVEQNSRFAIVETYAGAASRVARELDPRSQQATRRRRQREGTGASAPTSLTG
jgi:hypothetical protein